MAFANTAQTEPRVTLNKSDKCILSLEKKW